MSSERTEEAKDLCEEILALLPDIPESGSDFADSIEEKVTDIQAWIEEKNWATEAQLDTLQNMFDGVTRWLS